MEAIGKIERVDLRQVWPHEAHDFTRWLQDNIDVLNSAIDLSLVNVEREKPAGSFSIDLVAEQEGGGMVVIENQLEKSNHDHLGKLITYLTGMGAKTAIWIVADPRPEHIDAINWLNESTSAAFYLVKVEAVRIANSPPAAIFTSIVGPSEEATSVGLEKKVIASIELLRKRWWTQLIELCASKKTIHRHLSPNVFSWISTSSGTRGINFTYNVSRDESLPEVYIDRGKGADAETKAIFDKLHEYKAELEKSIGHPLQWERLEGKRACRIKFPIQGGYGAPEEQWPKIQNASIDAMSKLEAAFRPIIKGLNIGQ